MKLKQELIIKKKELSEGWNVKKLGEIAKYINGRAFKPSEWDKKGLPIIRIQNLTSSSECTNYFSGEVEDKYIIKDGELLLAWSATLDVFIWNKGRAVLNQHIFKVIPNNNLTTKEFLFYLLKNQIEKIKSETHGSGMVHITKPKLLNLKILLPPLPIQQKIVSKLNKQMEQIEMMKKEAEKEIQNIINYYKSFLTKMYDDKSWPKKKFGSLFYTRYGLSKASVNDPSKIKALRMNNISYEGGLDTNDICYLDLSQDELNKHRLQKSDIIFNRTNSAELVGKTTVFDIGGEYVAVSYLVVARKKDKNINSKFVSYFLNTPKMKKFFFENCDRAISQANFSASKLSEVEISTAPEPIQKEVVNKINKTKMELSKLNEFFTAQLESINQLPSSILNEVFGQYEIPEEA